MRGSVLWASFKRVVLRKQVNAVLVHTDPFALGLLGVLNRERTVQTAIDYPGSRGRARHEFHHRFGNFQYSRFSYPSNVDVNNRVVVYDIKDLGKQLKPLGMMVA